MDCFNEWMDKDCPLHVWSILVENKEIFYSGMGVKVLVRVKEDDDGLRPLDQPSALLGSGLRECEVAVCTERTLASKCCGQPYFLSENCCHMN
jgi:hypothetical protein